MDTLKWRKAKASAANGGGCVEVASDDRGVYVRDTKRRESGHLTVPADRWREFIVAIKANESGHLPRAGQ